MNKAVTLESQVRSLVAAHPFTNCEVRWDANNVWLCRHHSCLYKRLCSGHAFEGLLVQVRLFDRE
jgi:hypothetical protein